MAVCQNLVPLVNIKIAGKWMFIPLKMVLIGIDPYPYLESIANSVSQHGIFCPRGNVNELQDSLRQWTGALLAAQCQWISVDCYNLGPPFTIAKFVPITPMSLWFMVRK